MGFLFFKEDKLLFNHIKLIRLFSQYERMGNYLHQLKYPIRITVCYFFYFFCGQIGIV